MPIVLSIQQLPDGRRYSRSVSTGAVTGDDARAVVARLAPGGDLAGMPMLNIMEKGVDADADARKIFATMNKGSQTKLAVVTASAPLRVTMSFVLRASGQAAHTKFFGSEVEALLWLSADE